MIQDDEAKAKTEPDERDPGANSDGSRTRTVSIM